MIKAWPVRIAEFFSDYWLELVKLVITAIIAVTVALMRYNNIKYNGLWDFCWTPTFIPLVGALSLIPIGICEMIRKPRVSKLNEELIRARRAMYQLRDGIYEFTSLRLGTFAEKNLKFGTVNNCHERVTLYIFYEHTEFFINAGRFSVTPKYRVNNNRVYRADIGVIKKAWECPTGHFFDESYPKPGTSQYRRRCLSEGLSEDIFERLTMQSRLFYGYRITVRGKNRALLLLEATDKSRYNENDLKQLFQQVEIKSMFDELVETLTENMGIPDEAHAFIEGFAHA